MGTTFRDKDIEDSKNEKYSIKIKGMKMTDRSCTDILCCLVFVVFIFSCIGITGMSVTQGDPAKIMTPFDSDGNQCGQLLQDRTNVTNDAGAEVPFVRDFTDYPYKYFTNIVNEGIKAAVSSGGVAQTSGSEYNAVCVSECPTEMNEYLKYISNNDISTADAPKSTYISSAFMGYCVPEVGKNAEFAKELFEQMNGNSGIANYIVEIKESWKAMTIMAFGAFIITIIYLMLLKWITKPILYISLFGIFLFGVLGGGYLFMQKDEYDPESESYYYMIAGAAVVWVITFIYMVVICCQWNNIRLGASVMEAAGTFVSSNPRIGILPIVVYMCFCPIIVWWLFTSVFLYSIGTPMYEENTFVAKIDRPAYLDYVLWYILFGLFWFCAFVIAVQKFVTVATTCMWFFSGQGSENSDATGEVSIMLAVKWSMFKHIGSLAMGSFLIAVVTMIKVVFEYFAAQQEKVAGKENVAFKAIACCIRCCIWCLDAYVKFINENAYIQIALHNSNFCKGAWESFYLMIRHGGRFGSAAIVSFLMVWIGKGCIVALSVWLTILLVQEMHPEVTMPLIPAVFVGIFAYVVATLFLNIFSSSALAILHSFILTEDQDGPKDHIPESLKPFLDSEDFKDHENESEPGLKKKNTGTEDVQENQME